LVSVEVDWNREDPGHASQMLAEGRRLAGELRRLGATRVVLFGSRARGTERRDSDLDLLVIMPHPPGGTFPARLAAIYELVRPRVAVDLVVYTPDEVTRSPQNPLVAEALSTGVEL
jgi:predicted nucleotidyltransferase